LSSFAFELPPRVYEHIRRNAKFLRNGQEIGFVRLKKADERRKNGRLGRSGAKLVRPNSGQVEEAMGPAAVTERCRKRGKGQCVNILRGIIWRIGNQSLTTAVS
jgi:hypothetical protein